ncbi:MAG: ArsR family transcriptional regulator [Caulobacter sp.]|nr:ArsR family transcriptional regulator [Caulobacter sp.]
MEKIFEALASTPRRKILAYLSEVDLTAGEIASRFSMSKPAISKHLQILENAGLVRSEKRGQFVHYSLVPENLANTLNGFVQNVCPVSRPLKSESAAIKAARKPITE